MKHFNIRIFLLPMLLLPVVYCENDLEKSHDESNWIKHLPHGLKDILKARSTTVAVSNEESSLSIQDEYSSESINTEETTDLSVTPEIMNDYGDNQSSSKSVRIGSVVGSLILFFLICYCCFRCCCRNRETISQGVVIQPLQPPPQDQNQPNIVIQHIHGTPNLQPTQPAIMQHVPYNNAPPQMQQYVHAPQFQQQPPYPTGYETRQMLQQEWSPHAPMNIQQQQQQPAPDYPYNPSAPPPSYGKY